MNPICIYALARIQYNILNAMKRQQGTLRPMKRNLLWTIAALILFGCSEQLSEVLVSKSTPAINLTGSINQQNLTRANEQGFVTGDRMGIYIVDYDNGQPGQIGTDNRASNVIYTFDGDAYRWSAPTTIYWRDNTTPVDVYGYYPAANYIGNPSAYRFEVSSDQNEQREGEMSGYEASDFLWGKTANTDFTHSGSGTSVPGTDL